MSCNNKESPEWYVIIENVNAKKIEEYNIFNHARFLNDCNDIYENYNDDFETFEKAIENVTRYYFWAKCEWEIIISGFPPCDRFKDEKIDVFKQVKLNWDIFINYLWEYYKKNDTE